MCGRSVVHNAQVPRHDLVFQHGAGGNVDPIAVVGDDDDGALRGGRFRYIKTRTRRGM